MIAKFILLCLVASIATSSAIPTQHKSIQYGNKHHATEDEAKIINDILSNSQFQALLQAGGDLLNNLGNVALSQLLASSQGLLQTLSGLGINLTSILGKRNAENVKIINDILSNSQFQALLQAGGDLLNNLGNVALSQLLASSQGLLQTLSGLGINLTSILGKREISELLVLQIQDIFGPFLGTGISITLDLITDVFQQIGSFFGKREVSQEFTSFLQSVFGPYLGSFLNISFVIDDFIQGIGHLFGKRNLEDIVVGGLNLVLEGIATILSPIVSPILNFILVTGGKREIDSDVAKKLSEQIVLNIQNAFGPFLGTLASIATDFITDLIQQIFQGLGKRNLEDVVVDGLNLILGGIATILSPIVSPFLNFVLLTGGKRQSL